MADFTQHDTGSSLVITLVDQDGAVIDLTGATVALQYYIDSNPPLFTKQMTVTDPKTGICSYQFGLLNGVYDLASAGTMHFSVVVTLAGGVILSSPLEGQISISPAWSLLT
jgi:hypothetical protein